MPYDKKIHLGGSFIACAGLSFILPLALAAAVTLALGVIKEIMYDSWMGKGTPEWADFAADCAGVAIAIILVRGAV